MKKIFLIITLLVYSSIIMLTHAIDITTPLFGTFEDGTPVPFVLGAGGEGSEMKDQSIVDNPNKVVNTSDKCIKLNVPADKAWYSKTRFEMQAGTSVSPASSNHKYLHINIMCPTGINGIELCVFNTSGVVVSQQQIDFSNVTGWYDVIANIPAIIGNNIGAIWIRPFVSASTVCYFDQFELSDNPYPRGYNITKSPSFANFEDKQFPFNFTGDNGGTSGIANNPKKLGNTSNYCLKYTTPASMNWWDKGYWTFKDMLVLPASNNHKYLKFKAYRESGTDRSELAIFSNSGNIYQKEFRVTKIGEWQEFVFDLTGVIESSNIYKIQMASDLSGAANSTYFYDDFELSDNPASSRIADFEYDLKYGMRPFTFTKTNAKTGCTITQSANPSPGGLNTSGYCVKYNTPTGANPGAGDTFTLTASVELKPKTNAHKYLRFLYYRTGGTTTPAITVKDGSTDLFNGTFNVPSSNTWTEIVITLPVTTANTLSSIVFTPTFNATPADRNKAAYVDEIFLMDYKTPPATEWTNAVFATFEDGFTSPFSCQKDGVGTTPVTNPLATGINTTTKSIEATYANTTSANNILLVSTGAYSIKPVTTLNKYLHFFIYRNVISQSRIQITNLEGELVYQKDFTNTQTNQWEDIGLDLSLSDNGLPGCIGQYIDNIKIIHNITGSGSSQTYYYDEFSLSDDIPANIKRWNDPILVTFETGIETPFNYSIEGGVLDFTKNNPKSNTIDNSAKCIYGNYSSGTDWSHKIKLEPKSDYLIQPNSANHKYLHFLSYRDFLSESELQIYDNEGNRIYQKRFSNTTTNTWEEIVLDLTASDAGLPGIAGSVIGKIYLVNNIQSFNSAAQQYYYDYFVLSDSKSPVGTMRYLDNIGDFENGLNQSIMSMANQNAGATATIVNNPLPSDLLNTTFSVLQYTRPAGVEWWQSLRLFTDGFVGVNSTNRYLHFMMYNPAGQEVSVVINNITGEEFVHNVYPNQASEWQDYVIDLGVFGTPQLNNIRTINIRIPDDANANTYYFDEFLLNDAADPREAPVTPEVVTPEMNVSINPAMKYQTIVGFGASDAWNVQPVGKDWNNTTKENIAQWLFSNEVNSNGSPLGIGLSMWRVNLGAGSYEQGAGSEINDIERRTECFFDGSSYNWNKQLGQQYFFKKAKQYGVEKLVLFANTPPVSLTSNGKAWSGASTLFPDYNLASAKYSDYATFLTTVIKHFKDVDGITFDYVSPVNEPQYAWNEKAQEGSGCQNSQLKGVVSALNTSLASNGLSTKIMISEADRWSSITGNYSSLSTPGGTTAQLDYLFNQTNGGDLRSLSNLPKETASHSYWLDLKDSAIKSIRETAYSKATGYGVKLHQTEWCALSDNADNGDVDGIPSYDDASYMDMALWMAKIIYADLKYAQVISWSYWTALAAERYDQKNRFYLIRLNPVGGDYGAISGNDGNADANKNLWVLGNYSRFIKPGYQRIDLGGISGTNGSEMSDLMGTAYIAPDNSKVVAVFNNLSEDSKAVSIAIPSIPNKKIDSNVSYLTDNTYNLSNRGSVKCSGFFIPARSVQTIVFNYVDDIQTDTKNITLKEPVCIAENNMVSITQMQPGSQVKLFDVTGRLIYSVVSENEQILIPFNSKMGIVKISDGENTYIQKLIVF